MALGLGPLHHHTEFQAKPSPGWGWGGGACPAGHPGGGAHRGAESPAGPGGHTGRGIELHPGGVIGFSVCYLHAGLQPKSNPGWGWAGQVCLAGTLGVGPIGGREPVWLWWAQQEGDCAAARGGVRPWGPLPPCRVAAQKQSRVGLGRPAVICMSGRGVSQLGPGSPAGPGGHTTRGIELQHGGVIGLGVCYLHAGTQGQSNPGWGWGARCIWQAPLGVCHN